MLQRKWPVFDYLKPQREKHLPCVLTQEDVRRIPGHVKTFHNYAFLTTVYTCGIRLQEALHIQVSDIDTERMLIHVHRGKGTKDRCIPLPEDILALLRPVKAMSKIFREKIPGSDEKSRNAVRNPA